MRPIVLDTSDMLLFVEKLEGRRLGRSHLAYYETTYDFQPSLSFSNGKRITRSKLYSLQDLIYCLVITRLCKRKIPPIYYLPQLKKIKRILDDSRPSDLSGILLVGEHTGIFAAEHAEKLVKSSKPILSMDLDDTIRAIGA